MPVPPSLRPQSAWPRPSRAFSLVKTRRPPCACSVYRGKPSVSRSGPAVSTLIHKVSGLRRYRPGRFLREAAMTNAGPLAGTRRCISPHVFAVVTALWQVAFRVERPWRRRCRPTRITRKTLEPRPARDNGLRKRLTPRRGACSSADAPKGRGSERPPPQPRTSRAPLILRPRVITRRGHMPRASCGLRVPPLVRLRLDPDENGAPERVELS